MVSRRYPAEHYSRQEMAALLEACGEGPVGVRNRALIVVLWRSGLRLAEALALNWRDLDYGAQTIRVMHGKGDKTRVVGMDRRAFDVLESWRVVWEGMDFDKPQWAESPIFCTMEGFPLHQSYIRAMLPRLAKKAGVHRRVHAHGFRHTFAVELSRAGVPVRDIQQLLGHSSLAVTSVYLASLSPEEALEHVRGRDDW